MTSFRAWLTLGIGITLGSALLFATEQQVLRQGANDPQIQLAEDAAAALSAGQTVETVVPEQKVKTDKSLAPFVMVFDVKKTMLASSADGETPQLPSGVFDSTGTEYHSFTWQPVNGVRYAAVISKYEGNGGGYVVAARSLREVEKREKTLEVGILLGWIIIMAATYVGSRARKESK